MNIPVIGFDHLVQNLVSNGTVLPEHATNDKYCRVTMDTSGHLRILDRFQVCQSRWAFLIVDFLLTSFKVGFAVSQRRSTSNRTFRQKLVGCDDEDVPLAVISPYTQR